MIRYVKHQDIDPKRWDNAVKNAANHSVFGTYEILNILSGDQNWDAVVEDDYMRVMPLPYRLKYGIPYIYTPFFLPQMGVFSTSPLDAETTLKFFNIIPRRFIQIDLLFNPYNDISKLPENQICLISHEMKLQEDYESLCANFSQNTRRNIKSAEKHFLTIEYNPKLVENIIQLFQNNRGKSPQVHYKEQDYQNLNRAAQYLLGLNLLDVVGVRDAEQKLIAGALLVRDHQRVWFWFSGRDETAADSKPMFFLLNEYLKNKCESDLTFDFNGSVNENVARLYRGFGGIPYPIMLLQHSRLKLLQKIKSNSR